jgi:hypothetical protein
VVKTDRAQRATAAAKPSTIDETRGDAMEKLDAMLRFEPELTRAMAERVRAFQATGEKIHVLGLYRKGDDDASFSLDLLVDPLQSGTQVDYEPREDTQARLWRLKKDAPEALRELVGELADAHEDAGDPDDLPGRSMTPPHAQFTAFADRLATKLAAQTGLTVTLLCTELVPIEDDERAELRAWVASGGA